MKQTYLNLARTYLGVTTGSARHRDLIDRYNQVTPRPRGYQVTYHDAWCAAFVTVLGDRCGISHLITRECGVQRMIAQFQSLGIWQGRQRPQSGDLVCFDWDGNDFADHIGIVTDVQGERITTIEGNADDAVRQRQYNWSDRRICGYARPRYEATREGAPASSQSDPTALDVIARQVLRGDWGNGDERRLRLHQAGHDPATVQQRVNQLLAGRGTTAVDLDAIARQVLRGDWGNGAERTSRLTQAGHDPAVIQARVNQLAQGGRPRLSSATRYQSLHYQGATLSGELITQLVDLAAPQQILPDLLIGMLYLESQWGQSAVARADNNWAGMTWSPRYVGHPAITKSRGSARSASEGGHYLRYASATDFLVDWIHLLRANHTYQVSGQTTLADSVRGLFRVGGARYDYAGCGYEAYATLLTACVEGIRQANGGRLLIPLTDAE